MDKQSFLCMIDDVSRREVSVVAVSREHEVEEEFILNAQSLKKQIGAQPKEGMALSLEVDFLKKKLVGFKAAILTNESDITYVTKRLGPEKPLTSYSNDII